MYFKTVSLINSATEEGYLIQQPRGANILVVILEGSFNGASGIGTVNGHVLIRYSDTQLIKISKN